MPPMPKLAGQSAIELHDALGASSIDFGEALWSIGEIDAKLADARAKSTRR